MHDAFDQISPEERLATVECECGRWILFQEPVKFFWIIGNIHRQIFVNDDCTLALTLWKIKKGLCPAITAAEIAFISQDEMKVPRITR